MEWYGEAGHGKLWRSWFGGVRIGMVGSARRLGYGLAR